jgi:integrase
MSEAEQARDRALSAEELRAFYVAIDDTPSVGVIVSTLLRFLVAIGSQRPQQVLRTTWVDYDMDAATVRIIDTKGRSGRRVHLVPLSPQVLALLEVVKPLIGSIPWPWTATGEAPIAIESLNKAIIRYMHATGAERFSPRDLRPVPSN